MSGTNTIKEISCKQCDWLVVSDFHGVSWPACTNPQCYTFVDMTKCQETGIYFKPVMDGSCNHCTDRDRYKVVNVIELRGMSFRLCDKCKKALKKLL